jgi:hypothetical protein
VYLSNLILSRFDARHELERIDAKPLRLCLQQLGLEADSFQNLISSIPWETFNSAECF